MCQLYHNRVQFDWNVIQGEYAAYINYPFKELYLDPIFKVLSINEETLTTNIEVVKSSFLAVGTTYINQPLLGLRRVKLTNILDNFRYNTSI